MVAEEVRNHGEAYEVQVELVLGMLNYLMEQD
jgi:hypothetical protein